VRRRGVTGPDFDEWVALRGDALLRLAYLLTGSPTDAEDVVQDVLVRALPRWDRIAAADDVDAYVRRMVVNAHTSWWRRWRKRETPVEEARGSGHVDPVEPRDDALWRACLALPADQRAAVVLRFYEDLTYAEIAALAGVREGTVRSRVSRGIATLRAQVETLEDVR